MSKAMGTQDFSGQDGYEESASEGVADAPELAGVLRKTFAPTIDDPSQRKAASRLFQSNDDVLHLSRSAGLRIK